jgi:hypothetical protein
MKMHWLLFLTGIASPPDVWTSYGPFDSLAQCQAKANIVAPVNPQQGWVECLGVREDDPDFARSPDTGTWIDLNSFPRKAAP